MGVFNRPGVFRARPKSPKRTEVKSPPGYTGPKIFCHPGKSNPWRYENGTPVTDPKTLLELEKHAGHLARPHFDQYD